MNLADPCLEPLPFIALEMPSFTAIEVSRRHLAVARLPLAERRTPSLRLRLSSHVSTEFEHCRCTHTDPAPASCRRTPLLGRILVSQRTPHRTVAPPWPCRRRRVPELESGSCSPPPILAQARSARWRPMNRGGKSMNLARKLDLLVSSELTSPPLFAGNRPPLYSSPGLHRFHQLKGVLRRSPSLQRIAGKLAGYRHWNLDLAGNRPLAAAPCGSEGERPRKSVAQLLCCRNEGELLLLPADLRGCLADLSCCCSLQI